MKRSCCSCQAAIQQVVKLQQKSIQICQYTDRSSSFLRNLHERTVTLSVTHNHNHHHTIFIYDHIVCHIHLSMFLAALRLKIRPHNVTTVWMGFEYGVRIWYNTVICTEYSYCTCHCVTNSCFIYMFLFYLVMLSVAEIT
jgi:type IV secretory pathway TraG/TraD family ATPase VirD4